MVYVFGIFISMFYVMFGEKERKHQKTSKNAKNIYKKFSVTEKNGSQMVPKAYSVRF